MTENIETTNVDVVVALHKIGNELEKLNILIEKIRNQGLTTVVSEL